MTLLKRVRNEAGDPFPPVPGRVNVRPFARPMRSQRILLGSAKRMLIGAR